LRCYFLKSITNRIQHNFGGSINNSIAIGIFNVSLIYKLLNNNRIHFKNSTKLWNFGTIQLMISKLQQNLNRTHVI
jgi:hypothetical protein